MDAQSSFIYSSFLEHDFMLERFSLRFSGRSSIVGRAMFLKPRYALFSFVFWIGRG